ncbi:hypothetical protein DFH09DRAFT_1367173 [Mycena vulgaris]|nr:hypothetical protein DFH09DRAFT_1367173 [Mycena vulgaris]
MATSPSSAAYSLLYLYSPVRHSYEGSINARMEKGNGPPLQCPGTHLCPQLLGIGERVPHCVVTAPHGRACHSRWISLSRADAHDGATHVDAHAVSRARAMVDERQFSRTWCCTAASHEDERPPVFADISVAFRVRAGRRPRPTRRSARPTPCPSSTSSSGSPDPRTPSRPHGGCTVTVQCHRREAHVGARKRRWVIEAIRRLRRAIAGTLAWREDRGAGRDPCGAGVGRERHEEKGAGAPLPLPQPDAWGIRGGGPGGVAARSFAPAHIVDDVRSFSPTARKQVKPRGDVFRLAHTTRALVVENTTHLLKRLLMADRCVSSPPYAPRTRTGAVAQDPSVRARAHLLALQGRLRNRVQQYRANHEALWMFRANAPLAEPLEAAKSTPSSTWRAQSRSTHIARACASSPLIPREDHDLNDTALAEALNAPSPPAALRPHPRSFSTFVPREADAIDMRPRASPRPWSARARAAAPCTSQLRLLAGSTVRGRSHRAHRARSRSTHTSRAKKLAEMTTGSFADVFVDLALAEPLDAAFRPRCSPPGRLLAGDIVRGRRRGYGAREPLDATVAHSALGPPPSARPSSQFLAAGTRSARGTIVRAALHTRASSPVVPREGEALVDMMLGEPPSAGCMPLPSRSTPARQHVVLYMNALWRHTFSATLPQARWARPRKVLDDLRAYDARVTTPSSSWRAASAARGRRQCVRFRALVLLARVLPCAASTLEAAGVRVCGRCATLRCCLKSRWKACSRLDGVGGLGSGGGSAGAYGAAGR